MTNLLEPRHYMRLPMCGFCTNAWDIIYQRSPWDHRGNPADCTMWINLCPVGGCDPEVWDFLDEESGLPVPFPETDDRVFHRRSHDGEDAPWRKSMPRLVAQFCAIKNAKYQKVTDQYGNVLSKVVADDLIKWDEELETAPVADDDIEW